MVKWADLPVRGLPSFLLVAGALPFWDSLRRNIGMQAALAGINAAVVGLLLAALYQPVWTSAIRTSTDFAFALVAFIATVLESATLGSCYHQWGCGAPDLLNLLN